MKGTKAPDEVGDTTVFGQWCSRAQGDGQCRAELAVTGGKQRWKLDHKMQSSYLRKEVCRTASQGIHRVRSWARLFESETDDLAQLQEDLMNMTCWRTSARLAKSATTSYWNTQTPGMCCSYAKNPKFLLMLLGKCDKCVYNLLF